MHKLVHNIQISGLTLIDLRKAFDLVDHSTLLQKLQLYGRNEDAVTWFRSYLCDRQFQVVIDNQFSTKANITSGVPQGSILGPLLFILHMNDLPFHLSETEIYLYADDATQYVSDSSLQNVEVRLGREIQPVIQWSAMNKMVLNEKKTKTMLTASSQKLSTHQENSCVTLNGSSIDAVTSEKLLGVYFDQTLSWTGHVDSLCKSISQRLGVLRRIRHYLPYKAHVAFYNCLILSLMDCCCVVWGNTSKQNLDRIYRVQKRAARLILGADGKAPSLPLFLQLGWLPIHDRIKYFRAVTVYKALHNLAPSYISSLIRPFNRVHSFKTRGSVKDSLQLPIVTSKSGQRMFAFLASSKWNTLDSDIRNGPSRPSFRNRYLKMAFLKLEDRLIVL